MQMHAYPTAPLPLDVAESRRWLETRRRRRLLYGVWQQDLLDRLQVQLGGIRREAWGEPDLSSNVFRASVTALAVIYDRQPRIHHDQDVDGLVLAVQRAGLWSLLQRHQRDTIGMREGILFVDAALEDDADEGRVELRYRPVYPDMVIATPDPECPSEPIRVAEMRLRLHPKLKTYHWTWDIWDLTDPTRPGRMVREVVGGGEGGDLSDVYLGVAGGMWGDKYPARYRRADGTPVLPYAMRHAAVTGELWDAFEASELVEGSLNCAVLWTFFGHCVRNASWPQRYAVNVSLPSAGQEGTADTARDSVVADPATVLVFEVGDGGNGQPLIGQWQPGADPEKIQEAVALYERRVAAYAGIAPSDVQRVAGDPRSGFAIALNVEAQREAQRRYEPVCRPADEELLALSAIVANRVGGTAYPESGYRVAYQGLPPSPDERQAERDHSAWEVEQHLISPIDLYLRQNPGATRRDAVDAIVRSRLDELELEESFREQAAAMGFDPAPKPKPPAAPKPATMPKQPQPPMPGMPDMDDPSP